MKFNKLYEERKNKSKEYLNFLKQKNKLVLPRYESRLDYLKYVLLMYLSIISVSLNLVLLVIYGINTKIVIENHLELTVLNLLISASSVLTFIGLIYLFKIRRHYMHILPSQKQIFFSYGFMAIFAAITSVLSVFAIVYYDFADLGSNIIPLGFLLLASALAFVSNLVLASTYKKIYLLVQ